MRYNGTRKNGLNSNFMLHIFYHNKKWHKKVNCDIKSYVYDFIVSINVFISFDIDCATGVGFNFLFYS